MNLIEHATIRMADKLKRDSIVLQRHAEHIRQFEELCQVLLDQDIKFEPMVNATASGEGIHLAMHLPLQSDQLGELLLQLANMGCELIEEGGISTMRWMSIKSEQCRNFSIYYTQREYTRPTLAVDNTDEHATAAI